jgi:hypothetical protein
MSYGKAAQPELSSMIKVENRTTLDGYTETAPEHQTSSMVLDHDGCINRGAQY